MPSNTGRVLAIDYGVRRVGLAVSDELGIIASGAGTMQNGDDFLSRLMVLIMERDIGTVIIGLPLTLRGEHGVSAAMVEKFADQLREATTRPVHLVDERFTSSIAERTIREMGVGKKKRRDKGKVDEIAAIILLQGYLDTHTKTAGI
ncbi:MAG: Holliday junction resolvase RuvX [Bacteroidota bacterium]|nr:Holliday junction resolvase RuvX [Bacteroidota bacterium]